MSSVEVVKSVVELVAARTKEFYDIWNIYYTVTAGFILLIAGLKIKREFVPRFSFVCSVLYAIFCVGNFRALSIARSQRISAIEYALSIVDDQKIKDVLAAMSPESYWLFAVYYCAITIAAITLFRYIPSLQRPDKE